LDSYRHIELTDDEYCAALIDAKRKKEAIIKQINREKRAEENRKMLIDKRWNYAQIKKYMLDRATKIFTDPEDPFILDKVNTPVFDLLCYYFTEDPLFIEKAKELKVNNPSLKKGILLAGNYGVGKTWLMSLFRKNNRQVYHVEHAKPIAKAFHANGEEAIQKHYTLIKNAIFDPTVLYQQYSGLCIEDIGREDIKNNYGNRTNVIGDIMEQRYINKCMGVYFHATTNFTVEQLEQFYGGMVVDRFRECLNLIELKGESRRKKTTV
jgi:DNA replication protein DnaC